MENAKDDLMIMVNDSFKESFYKKRKKVINVLTVVSIFYKSGVKTFIKWIINHCPKGTR